MKLSWPAKALIAGLFSGALSFLLLKNSSLPFIENWQIALVIAAIVFVIVIRLNPKSRYYRAFGMLCWMIVALNGLIFKIAGKLFGITFTIESPEASLGLNWILGILGFLALVLDYLERNDKLKGTFLEIKKNKVGDVTGNNNQINQNIS